MAGQLSHDHRKFLTQNFAQASHETVIQTTMFIRTSASCRLDNR